MTKADVSAEIVNLSRARKDRARRDKDDAAQANRVAYGRTQAERTLTGAQKRMEAARLDAHRREPEEKT